MERSLLVEAISDAGVILKRGRGFLKGRCIACGRAGGGRLTFRVWPKRAFFRCSECDFNGGLPEWRRLLSGDTGSDLFDVGEF